MVERWKGGVEQDCNPLNQKRKETARLKTQKVGAAVRLP
jgi:hypothetical protein